MGYFDLERLKYIIVHHTAENVVGPSFIDWPSEKLKKYLSGVGYKKGYEKYGYDQKSGYSSKFRLTCPLVDPETGKHVFPMYHISFRKFSESPTGWIGTLLVKDPLKYNVNSLSGDWPDINKSALSINFCGNFEKADIDNAALYTAAAMLYNLFHVFKPEIKGHKDFDRTGCPGKIYEKLLFFRELFDSGTVKKMAMFTKQIV